MNQDARKLSKDEQIEQLKQRVDDLVAAANGCIDAALSMRDQQPSTAGAPSIEGLTDSRIDALLVQHGKGDDGFREFARAIEREVIATQSANTCALEGLTGWTPDELRAFTSWVNASFPNESSVGVISLSEAWKQGQAFATQSAKQGAQAALEQAEPVAWINAADRLPIVPANDSQQFIVACRRGHNGKTYVFAADYLNARDLHNDEDGAVSLTGWHIESQHPEYNGWFEPVCQSGDEVTHWQPLPALPGAAPAAQVQAEGSNG